MRLMDRGDFVAQVTLTPWKSLVGRGVSASEAETETSPGVLLSSGYIAGGTLCGLLYGFLVMAASVGFLGLPTDLRDQLNFGEHFAKGWEEMPGAKLLAVAGFAALAVILFMVGSRKATAEVDESRAPEE